MENKKEVIAKAVVDAVMVDMIAKGKVESLVQQVTISVCRFEQLLKAEVERNMARNIYMNNESWNLDTALANLFGSRPPKEEENDNV